MKTTLTAVVFSLLISATVFGAPFAEKFPFRQPDGKEVILYGQGDEFYAVFEDLDGYLVTFNQATKAHHYAKLSAGNCHLSLDGVLI